MDICDIGSCDRHENGQIKVEYLAAADHENPNPATREPKHPEDRRYVRLRATIEFLHLAIYLYIYESDCFVDGMRPPSNIRAGNQGEG